MTNLADSLPRALAAAPEIPGVDPIINIQRLNHFYGEGETRAQVLFDNRLEVMPGEIVIMTGPSGSGKTTLLTLVSGLRTVQDGSVKVIGRELNGLGPAGLIQLRRGIGFIFQAHNLFDSLTAYQNVRMAMELQDYSPDDADTRIRDLLTQLGLGHRIFHKPHQLSGGQRQRVAIARALANRPKLVLADEPTAALDEKSGRDVVTMLQALAQEQGTTSLIVTHDNRILDVADRIVNMVGGRIKSNVRVKEAAAVCEFLSQASVFKGLTPQQLADVAERMRRAKFPAGAAIVRQGEVGDRFYLIRKGSVDVLMRSADGAERGVTVLHEAEFFGERALITGEPRNATVVAREDIECYTLDKAEFQEALDASAPLKEQVYRVFFQRQ
jgi:putative ABC transport system ATP-binding protein